MELRELEYFRAVARCKSFRRAASELHVSQPTLSQQIKKLEGELGVALLARNSRAVAITDSGHTFLQRVESILTEVQTARTEMQALGALAGKLVVGTTAMAQYHIP